MSIVIRRGILWITCINLCPIFNKNKTQEFTSAPILYVKHGIWVKCFRIDSYWLFLEILLILNNVILHSLIKISLNFLCFINYSIDTINKFNQ